MSSTLRKWKESPLALRLLNLNCRRLLQKARESRKPELLATPKTVYALERRVLDYLKTQGGAGIGDKTPQRFRDAFATVCDALIYLRDNVPAAPARDFNKRLNTLESLGRVCKVRSYPIRCYFEPTNQCNLRCRMCGQRLLQGERSILPKSAVEKVTPLFRWMDEVSIFGFGESLLVDYLDTLLDAIPESCSSKLISNGVLLTEEKGRMLVDHGLKTLCISLDAVNPETYRLIRGVNKFEEVKRNIASLTGYMREKSLTRPEVILIFVIMRDNVAELPGFVRMAAEIGARGVSAEYMVAYSEEMREQSLFYDQELADRWVAEAEKAAAEIGMRFYPPPRFSGPGERASRSARCNEPWEFLFFRSDGFVSPCCVHDAKFGAWRENDFWDVWNSPSFQELRRTIHTPEQPDACRRCNHTFFRNVRDEAAHIRILPETS